MPAPIIAGKDPTPSPDIPPYPANANVVHRHNQESSGEVEKIVNAVKTVALQRETAFCDTFRVYKSLERADKKKYYKDTAHQEQAGLNFIGKVLFDTIEE